MVDDVSLSINVDAGHPNNPEELEEIVDAITDRFPDADVTVDVDGAAGVLERVQEDLAVALTLDEDEWGSVGRDRVIEAKGKLDALLPGADDG